MTVDRQMKRYDVPRICFINKMDRPGANPWRVIDQIRSKLHLNATAIQVPIGSENNLAGVVDLIDMKAYYNSGDNGENVVVKEIPADILSLAKEKRKELIESLADVDELIGDLYLNEEIPSNQQIKNAIQSATLQLKFVPVLMGSAYHNKSVQPLLDAIISYLPPPHKIQNFALDTAKNEEKTLLSSRASAPFLGLAFKLEESRFGQLTYLRIYQGTLRRGDTLVNVRTNKKVKVPRLVRMHSADMEDVDLVGSGEICALFGVDCASGDTFSNGSQNLTMVCKLFSYYY
jgi:elongation factor G